ncbi:MAG: AAA family ATPase [Burkholderiaceae bacterium]|nr:AAA family ATPase [Burkholderiaceae bacterium]
MLIVFSGLPGTGKTTIAQILARQCRATYLRIDAIEQAILPTLPNRDALGALGYLVAYQMARANLCVGGTVVADAVNPLTTIRETWRTVANNASSRITEVEVVCSDMVEHRRRVESRTADIPGHTLPTWDEVQQRAYEPWSSHRLVIDSAKVSAIDAASKIFDTLELHQ